MSNLNSKEEKNLDHFLLSNERSTYVSILIFNFVKNNLSEFGFWFCPIQFSCCFLCFPYMCICKTTSEKKPVI